MKIKHAIVYSIALTLAWPVMADQGHGQTDDHTPMANMLGGIEMDAARGMVLFTEKGCVACHSVNGVGGEDAIPLDAHDMEKGMNPFELAAKMWRMAPVMIAAQEEAFGEQILFTGQELADIVAFLHADAEQHKLTEASLTPHMRSMMDHEHSGMMGENAHAEELGYDDD
jgi:cytochrome c